MLLAVCFAIYYLTYVQQHREYLLNRNYRVLATLGEQLSETLANQTATLTSYANAFEGGEFSETMKPRATVLRTRGKPDMPFQPEKDLLQVDGQFKMSAEFHSFAPRLHHVNIRHIMPFDARGAVTPDLVRRDGQWMFQLAAVDNDGVHQASATISLRDLSLSFSPSIMGYLRRRAHRRRRWEDRFSETKNRTSFFVSFGPDGKRGSDERQTRRGN
jgi:hypothetical protein